MYETNELLRQILVELRKINGIYPQDEFTIQVTTIDDQGNTRIQHMTPAQFSANQVLKGHALPNDRSYGDNDVPWGEL